MLITNGKTRHELLNKDIQMETEYAKSKYDFLGLPNLFFFFLNKGE